MWNKIFMFVFGKCKVKVKNFVIKKVYKVDDYFIFFFSGIVVQKMNFISVYYDLFKVVNVVNYEN